MSQYQHFTSLPPEQEATFIVYEQRQAEAQQKGATLGIITGVALGVVALIIALVVTPTKAWHEEPQKPSGSQVTKPVAAPVKADVAPTPAAEAAQPAAEEPAAADEPAAEEPAPE
jgi:cytoskeletal protein RodZ